MIKMAYIDDDTIHLQVFCDVCGRRVDGTGFYAAKPAPGEVKQLHAGACLEQGTKEGTWFKEPLGKLPGEISLGLNYELERKTERKERILAAILRTVSRRGERGATLRDLQRMHATYTAKEIQDALQHHITYNLIHVAPRKTNRNTVRYIAFPIVERDITEGEA